MGHIEPGGAAGADVERLWRLWARLKADYPVWSFGFSNMRSRTAWGLWGNDLVTGLRRTRAARRSADLLKDAPPTLMSALRELAEINVGRHDQMFRAVALGYLTLPLGAGALAADVAPSFLQEIYAEHAGLIWFTVVSFALTVYLAMVGLWRARQMASVLDLVIVERSCAEPERFPQPISRAA